MKEFGESKFVFRRFEAPPAPEGSVSGLPLRTEAGDDHARDLLCKDYCPTVKFEGKQIDLQRLKKHELKLFMKNLANKPEALSDGGSELISLICNTEEEKISRTEKDEFLVKFIESSFKQIEGNQSFGDIDALENAVRFLYEVENQGERVAAIVLKIFSENIKLQEKAHKEIKEQLHNLLSMEEGVNGKAAPEGTLSPDELFWKSPFHKLEAGIRNAIGLQSDPNALFFSALKGRRDELESILVRAASLAGDRANAINRRLFKQGRAHFIQDAAKDTMERLSTFLYATSELD